MKATGLWFAFLGVVLLLILESCATMGAGAEDKLHECDHPVPGERCRLAALFYSQWEESGAFDYDYLSLSNLTIQKTDAYCFSVPRRLHTKFGNAMSQIDEGLEAAWMEVIVVFEEYGPIAGQHSLSNSCEKGRIRVEEILSHRRPTVEKG